MANQWFKFYGGEYLSDPKMLALSATRRSCWITLLAYASQTNGIVKFLDENTLMSQSGISFSDEEWEHSKGVLEMFEKLDMIRIDNGVITVKNWQKRQETALTPYERVKRHREKNKDDNDDNEDDNDRREENRIDKNRIEENRGESVPTPKQSSKKFFNSSKEEIENFVLVVVEKTGASKEFVNSETKKFISYWTEKNKGGTKEKWELEQTFEVDRRLNKWLQNAQKWSKEKQITRGKSIV